MASRPAPKVAVVTGGSGGLGRVVCERLRDEGMAVVSFDPSPYGGGVALATSRAADDPNSSVYFCPVDITSTESCRAGVRETLAAFGRIDRVVNCAGINIRGRLVDTEEAAWQQVLDVNLTGTYRMCRAVFKALRDSRGSLVNVSSTNGDVAVEGSAAYCVSKAGVTHLTRVLALEWAADGVRVNAVAPTLMRTKMTEGVLGGEGYLDRKLANIPLGRLATPVDVADAIAYLLSDKASMITGHVLMIDGGLTIR